MGKMPMPPREMILQQIVENKRIEVERLKKQIPESKLRSLIESRNRRADFRAALSGAESRVRLICEIKKASPSAGILKDDFDPVAIAQAYQRGGADALSILTEEKFFLGGIDHITAIRNAGIMLPILRKDFTCDLYQIPEAAAFGADAVLLIVGVMSDAETKVAIQKSAECGLAAVVEVHSEDELRQALDIGSEIIQINNRDLRTFKVDLSTTERLLPLISPGIVVIAASGVRGPEDMRRLRAMGVHAALVGETLMRHADPAAAVAELVAAAR